MIHEESKIQIACVKWFRLQYPLHNLFAIPNGGRRGKIEAAIMKGEGVLAGVADLFLSNPSKGFHGLYIEMKTQKGKQNPNQIAFQRKVELSGYRYVICRSLDDFIEEVNKYLI